MDQNQSDEAESNVKSWGFRRTTIARREFLDEVGDLFHSPAPVRRGRSRRSNQTPQATTETTVRTSQAVRSVIDGLEWSPPSSPVSQDSKPASETSAGEGGALDSSIWKDCGSAFHTALSLLGGNDDLSMEMPDALALPDNVEATEAIEASPPQIVIESDTSDNTELSDIIEIPLPQINDVVMISSQEEDTEESALMEIEQLDQQVDTAARGRKGRRGKARGRGRGRGRGRSKGKGRGKNRSMVVEIADDDDSEDDMVFGSHFEKQQEEAKDPLKISPDVHPDISLSLDQQLNSDMLIIEGSSVQTAGETAGQYDDALQEEEKEAKDDDNTNAGDKESMSDSNDPDTLYCICRQKQNDRFMICCDSCRDWFHGDCVGITKTQGRKMERSGQEFICPPCTTKKQSQLQTEPCSQSEEELSFAAGLTLDSPGDEQEGQMEPQDLKETAATKDESEEPPLKSPKPEPEEEMETHSPLPLCIGPGCSQHALPDSVYCGPNCILQHAAITMKNLSGTKVPKSRRTVQRKAATARPTARGQRPTRMSKRLAEKVEEEEMEEQGEEQEAGSPSACDPSLTDVQTTSLPASNIYTASTMSSQVKADSEDATLPAEDTSTDSTPSSKPATEPGSPQIHSSEISKEPLHIGVTKEQFTKSKEPLNIGETKEQSTISKEPLNIGETKEQSTISKEPQNIVVTKEQSTKSKEPFNNGAIKEQSTELSPCTPHVQAKCSLSPAAQSPSTSAPRLHGTGAVLVHKTAYVIPKKQSGSQPPSSQVSASASCQKPPSTPMLMSENRNLPVPPAPSAPSSRPSQPNNQVRQSIQRSLTGILFKRVCDCEDLEMSESEAAKLVASIEAEMFNIFRNTDSKYMNKYRTIMFNLKDPRNKGLLYGIVNGEISPFRLSRMSQKDMQAIKASEPIAKETTEDKDAAAKATTVQYVPEVVKVDLPSLNPARPEQKKSLSAPAPKTITSPPSQSSALPDVLACMLKDTTSEHKTHIFDLKCKICTGQIHQEASKKSKVPERQDKYESPQRTPAGAGDDSPLLAPPDSPDMDSPTSSLIDSSPRLVIDCPSLTIIESPASPVMDSPGSPALDSSASSAMNSPASLASDTSKTTTTKRPYTPVVIPAVSTITITRRDPRTAASRFSAVSSGTPGPSNTTLNQSVPYARLQEIKLQPPSNQASSLPLTKPLPKSILMKPTSSADPRLYGASSRTMISESPADDETTQFLAKQDVMWKGFLNMVTVAKFVTKGYLVSGSAENLKADLPGTIEIGGRILPQTVWDYVGKVKTSVTKELCVIRFHPATEEEEVAYVSLFSYFSSRNRFGVVANNSHSVKDVYLVPLGAKESIPSILQPLKGPGFEKNRPNLLLALAIIQKTKRPGNFTPEIEEKRPKVHMPRDPMWIPKPPVLYGSDKLEIFQPYDPETPASTTPPASPGTSSELSSGSVTVPSLVTSTETHLPVPPPATAAATQSTTNIITETNVTTASSNGSSLQTILKSLFGNNQTDSTISTDQSSTATETTVNVKKLPVFSQVSGSMADPIVQQYGQKSKIKEIEEEDNEFDRPYDPEEEYDPAIRFGTVASQDLKNKANRAAVSDFMDNDVAYDPEDETIFVDIQSGSNCGSIAANVENPAPNHMSDSQPCPIPVSTQAVKPVTSLIPAQSSSPAGVTQNHSTDTVVVSAATLSEQQRMLEELNKQIEEQKRQLKEQEEALRQQREAVGMFMARFSVADTLMSPPSKAFTPNQLSSLQSGLIETQARPSQSTDKTSSLTETTESSKVDSHTVKLKDTAAIPSSKNDNDSVMEQGEILEIAKESDKYSSAGEIEDSDVAYDPEDESLFNEIQEEVFQKDSTEAHDSFHKSTLLNSYHSRKRRPSPKRRRHHEKDRHRSPSRKSQRRSPSHSQRRREKDRHRRSERDRSRHRSKELSERHGRHRREHSARRHSHGHKRSPSPPREKGLESLSPEQNRVVSPQHLDISTSSHNTNSDSESYQLKCNLVESPDKDVSHSTHKLIPNVKLGISEPPTPQELYKESSSAQGVTTERSPTQVDTFLQQENLLKNKIDSTIPLRELDPPTRDSPQSPDPEPQFLNPFSTEKRDKMKDSEPHTSFSNPLVKVDQNCLTIGSLEGPNIQATEPNVDPMTDQGIQKLGAEEYGHLGTQAYLRKPGILSSVSGPHIPNFSVSESELKEHMLAPPVTISHIDGFGAQNVKKEPDMEDPSLGRPELEIKGSEAWGPSSASHPSPDTIRLIGVVERKAPDVSCPLTSQKYRRDGPNIGVMSSAVRDGDPGPGDSSAIANQSWGLQRGGDVHMAKTGSNVKFENSELNRFHFGQNSETREHFNKAPPNRAEGIALGSDMSKPEAIHKLRGPDMTEQGSLRPRQYLKDVGASDPGYERVPLSDTAETNWRSPGSGPLGPDIRSQRSQDKVLGPQRRDPGWCGPGSDTNDDWIGPDKRRSGLVREGPFIQDEWGVHQPEKRDPNMEDMIYDRRRPQGPNVIATGHLKGGLDREVPVYDRREPASPHFMGPVPERRISHTDIPVPDRRGPGGPDFVRAGTERRALHMDGPRSNRRGPEHPGFRGQEPESRDLSDGRGSGNPNFRRPGPERIGLAVESPGIDRRPEGCDFRGRGPESRDPSVEFVGPDRRGPQRQGFSGPSGRSGRIGGLKPDGRELGGQHFEEQGPEKRHLVMHGLGPQERQQNDSDLPKPMCENRDHPFQDQDTDRRGLYKRASGLEPTGPSIDSPGPHARRLSGSHFKNAWPDSGHHNMEGPGPDIREPRPERPDTGMTDPGLKWREPKGPILRQPGLHHLDPKREGPMLDVEARGDRFFPKGPHIREEPWLDRKGTRSPDFRGPGCDDRDPDMSDLGPDRAEPGVSGFRGSGYDGRDPNIRDRGPGRPEPGGSGFREHWRERRGPEMMGPGSDWRPGGHGFGGPGMRQEDPNTDGPRHGGGDWDEPHFGGSEPEDSLDLERPGPERKNRLWGPGPMSRNRGPGPNMGHLNRGGRQRGPEFSGSPRDKRGEGTEEEQWSDARGHNYEDVRNERDHFGNDWKRHANRKSGLNQEGAEAHIQDHRQGSFTEWRGPENSESKPIQRPNMPFDDWRGSHFRGSVPLRDDPDMIGPGPNREGPENEWREPDCIGAGSNRLGPGQSPGNRGRGHNRRGTQFRGPQSDRRGGPDMRNEWRQPDYRDEVKRQNFEHHGPHRDGLDLMSSNRIEMEGPDRKGPKGPEVRPENRNSNLEGPGPDGRFMERRGLGPDRRDLDVENPEIDRKEFGGYSRGKRGSGMRRLRPNKHGMRVSGPGSSDITHESQRWNINTQGRELEPRFVNRPEVERFQEPRDLHSAPYTRPDQSGRIPGPGFGSFQNQQTVKPQRHKGALLPTPTGLICPPSHMINNPNILRPK